MLYRKRAADQLKAERQNHLGGNDARKATTDAEKGGERSGVKVLFGMLRLVDHIVVGLFGGTCQIARVDCSVRVVLHAEAAVFVGASGSALLVVLGLLGRLIGHEISLGSTVSTHSCIGLMPAARGRGCAQCADPAFVGLRPQESLEDQFVDLTVSVEAVGL